ncbi:MAG: 2-amino-4-hydroxy-6-hydroxymethyldihydropteridine diphosphokinase [Pirellulales bacterium]
MSSACLALAALNGLREVARSRWYETSPIGGPLGQEAFLNGAALWETSLAPQALLQQLHAVELMHDRDRNVPWGPRTLDLDLLLFDDVVLRTPELTIPHPRLSFRKFVLRGAAEAAGDMRHPFLGRTMRELADHLETAPRYVAFVGMSPGFRMQFAAEAAEVSRARLVDPTPGEIPAFETLAAVDGPQPEQRVKFAEARRMAIVASLADAGDQWVADDGYLVDELRTLAGGVAEDDFALSESLRPPRLIARLVADDAGFQAGGFGLPQVELDVRRREESLAEFAAALDAAG